MDNSRRASKVKKEVVKRKRKNRFTSTAIRCSVSCPEKLWELVVFEGKKNGGDTASKIVVAALLEYFKKRGMTDIADEAVRLTVPKKSVITRTAIPADMYSRINKFAVRVGRGIPSILREGVALFIRKNGDAPEFDGFEEWKFIDDPDPI